MIRCDRSGYIAIATALIVSGAVILLVSVLGLGSFLVRSNILDSYYKNSSYSLAEACVQVALFKVMGDPNYVGGENISIASDTCTIVSVVASSSNKIIRTQAIYHDSYTNLQVGVATGTITSWRELAQ